MTMTFDTLAPVQCTPWCEDGAGHTDAEAPDEQFCRSAPHTVELAETPDGAGGTWRSRMYLNLYRDAEDDERSGATRLDRPRIEVVGPGADTLSLSAGEARTLARTLLELAATAERTA
jgi:hypothetical protein